VDVVVVVGTVVSTVATGVDAVTLGLVLVGVVCVSVV
jgi:hypothetical protein